MKADEPYRVQGVNKPDSMKPRIGRFEVREELGQGAFGKVYRAYDSALDRDVAVKIPKFKANEPGKVRRFLTEAKAAARLRHPNLVPVFEAGQDGDHFYIVSEYIVGEPLSQRIARDPPTFRYAAQWVRDLALALAYAHREGIVHRDIKPANIMIDSAQRAQLMDFGMAKRLSDSAETEPVEEAAAAAHAGATAAGTILGTPLYMSPEQARGDIMAVGPQSDQYSLGVVLYELLTGQRPLEEATPKELLAAVIAKEPLRPRQIDRRIPYALQAVCLRAMAKDPANRYPTAGEMAVDLQHWLNQETDNLQPITRLQLLAAWYREQPRALLVLGAVVIAAVVGGWYAYRVTTKARQPPSLRRPLPLDLSRAHGQTGDRPQLVLCDRSREEGLHRCETQRPREGVLLLARACQLATRIGDQTRRLQALKDLIDWTDKLPPLPETESLPAWLRKMASVRTGLRLPEANVNFAAFRPDGRILTSDGHFVRLWNAFNGEPLEGRSGYSPAVPPSAFTPYGLTLIAGDQTLQLVYAAGGKPVGRAVLKPGVGAVGAVFLSRDASTAVVLPAETSEQHRPESWNTVEGRLLHQVDVTSCPPDGLTFGPDGKKFVARSVTAEDCTAVLWDAAAGQLAPPFSLKLTGQEGASAFTDKIVASALSSDNRTFAILVRRSNGPPAGEAGVRTASGPAERIHLWDAAKGALVGTVTPENGAKSLVFDPSGEILVTTDGKVAQRWNAATCEPTGPPFPHEAVRAALLAQDGKRLLTCGDRDARLWDTATGLRVSLPLEYAPGFSQAVLRNDGEALITIHQGAVCLWPPLLLGTIVSENSKPLMLWAEVLTGMELGTNGEPHPLDAAAWKDRRESLEKLASGAGEESQP